MRTPAAALAWEFRTRHRWGLRALAGYLLVFGAIRLVVLGPRRVDFESAEGFALAVVVPMTATFLLLLGVFSYGLSGDLAARQSMYPARAFTLPVSSRALVGWPMLYGCAALALLWLTVRVLLPWPSGVDVPVFWPAFLGAALLAWTQALMWMPYPVRGLRVAVAVLLLTAMDSVVLLALEFRAGELVMMAILAPLIPLGYLTARRAVARARRGDVPDWRARPAHLGRAATVPPRGQRPFSSPARAQAWFEWRQHGRSLPAWVAILLPFELALLPVFRGTPGIFLEVLLGVLFTPPLMAAFVSSTFGRSDRRGIDAIGLPPFFATRPLESAAFVAAKLKAALRSTLATWLLVAVAIPLALWLSGTAPLVIERQRRVAEAIGTPRAAAWTLLFLAALMASTWKQLVQGLFIGMSGREWAVKASVFGTLALLALAGPFLRWIGDDRSARAALWHAIPWILAVLAGVKLTTAFWIAVRLYDSGALGERILVAGAATWCACALALYAFLVWLLSPLFARGWFVALVAILMVPLARISAAPLALAWNRHR